jgi:hypothetical protein
VCHGWNEMYYFDDAAQARTWRVGTDGSWGFQTARVKQCEPMWLDPVLGHSQLLTRMRWALATKVEGEVAAGDDEVTADATDASAATKPARPQPYDRRALEVWRTNLRLLRETSKTLGAEMFVCKQPTLIVADLPARERERCHYHLHHFGHAAHVSAFNAIYRVIDEEIAADRVIDLTSLSGKPELFFDHIHPTEDGTTQIARIVADYLAGYVRRADPRTGGRLDETKNGHE